MRGPGKFSPQAGETGLARMAQQCACLISSELPFLCYMEECLDQCARFLAMRELFICNEILWERGLWMS